MAEQKIYEGRAELNVEPFLASLKKMEDQASQTTTALQQTFQRLDSSLNSVLSAVKAQLNGVSSDLTNINKAVQAANATLQTGQQQLQASATQAQTAQRQSQQAAQARSAELKAQSVQNAAALQDLKGTLRQEQDAYAQHMRDILTTVMNGGQRVREERAADGRKRLSLERDGLEAELKQEQQIRQRAINAQVASIKAEAAQAKGQPVNPYEALSTQQYAAEVAVAEQSAAKIASIRSQLNANMRADSQLAATMAKQSADDIERAYLRNIQQTGTFGERVKASVQLAAMELKKFEDEWNSIYRAGSQISQLGFQISMFGGILSALGVSLIKNAGDFDFWATRASAATKVANEQLGVSIDKSIISTERFRDAALQVGKSLGVLQPEDVAQSWYLYQSAVGATIRTEEDFRQVQNSVNTLLHAAVITNTDAATTIRGVTSALAEFGQGTDQLDYFTAVLLNLTQTTQAEFTDVLQSAKMAGPLFARLGMDVGDFATAVGILADNNVRGSQAGRLLASGLTNLIRPVGATADALKDLFVTQSHMTDQWEKLIYHGGEFVGLFDTLDAQGKTKVRGFLSLFSEATQGMTNAQREFYIATIFGKEGAKTYGTLIDSYAKALEQAKTSGKGVTTWIDELNKKLHDPNMQLKLFSDQWEEVASSVKVRMGQVTYSFTELKERLGIILAANLLPLLEAVDRLVRRFMDWAKENPETANALTKVAIAVTALLLVVGPLLSALGFMVQGIAGLQLAGKAIGTVFTALRSIFTLTSASTAAMGATAASTGGILAKLGAFIAGLNWPMLLILATLAILVVAWRNNWGNIRETLRDAAEAIGSGLQAIVGMVGAVLTILTGVFNGNNDLIKKGAKAFVIEFIELFMVIPEKLIKVFENLASNMGVWGHNIIVALANGMIDGGRYVVAAAWAIAKAIAEPFESHSPPVVGPLRGIREWGKNLINTLIEGMRESDFDAVLKIADQIGEALKRNIEDKIAEPSIYASTMSQANNLVDDMLSIVRDGGRVNEDFFSSLRKGLGEWYEYIVDIALAYQDVYANERQLKIEQAKLDAIKAQREELEKQAQLRENAFDSYLRSTSGGNYETNAADMVDPLTPEGKAKIEEMRKSLSKEDFQNWLNYQKQLWEQKKNLEDQSLQAQEDAQQTQVDLIQAQLDAAQKQYDTYKAMYDYAVKMYELAQEQKDLEEERLREQQSTTGTPEQLKEYTEAIKNKVGPDTVIQDEGRLREQSGDDIQALAKASEQKEKEQKRLDDLEAMNRRKQAEFEQALINAGSDAERERIKQQKDAWDAAYKDEKAHLQERIDLAKEVEDAAEKAADASKAAREAEIEAKFREQILKLFGLQTGEIEDANKLKAEGGSLDDAEILAKSQLREEERKLNDLQQYGDQKRLEWEQKIREAAGDPEKLRRIKEEQEAWETAYKKAYEAQQARVEAARRAEQDIQDEIAALNAKKEKGGFESPDFGAGGLGDAEQMYPQWMKDLMQGKLPWEAGGEDQAPRKTYLQSIEIFDKLRAAIKFLGDESVPSEVKVRLLGQAIGEWLKNQFGVKSLWDIPTFSLYTELGLDKLPDDFRRFREGFEASWNTFWNWTLPLAWMDFKTWWGNLWGGIGDWWVKNFATTFPVDFSGVFQGAGLWFNNTFGPTFQGDWQTTWGNIKSWWSDNFSTPFSQSWSTDWASLKSWWTNNFSTPFATSWSTDWGNLKTWWSNNFSTPFSQSWSTDWGNLKTWWTNNFSTPFNTNWNSLWSGLQTAWDTFKGWFKDGDGGWDKLWAALKKAWDDFWQPVKDGWDKLVSGIGSVLQPIIDFATALSKLHFPKLPDWGSGGDDNDSGGTGHADGLYNVPYDNYRAVLHAGERVLTAQEAAVYNTLEAALRSLGSAATRVANHNSKSVTVNVGAVNASNPDEGRAFLNQLAFFTD